MAEKYTIPRPNSPFSEGGGNPTRAWYNFLRNLDDLFTASDAGVQAEITELAYKLGSPDGTVDNIPPLGNVSSVQGKQSIASSGVGVVQLNLVNDADSVAPVYYYGTDSAGAKGWQLLFDAFADTANIEATDTLGIVSFDLTDLTDSGAGSLLATTFDAKGRKTGSRAATITGAAGRVTVANGDASAGLPTIDLDTVTDAGGGTLQKTAFDTYGRKTGTSAATTDDLTEGVTNLYYTDARADARIEDNALHVDITGGTIDGTSIGATTPSSGAFTTLSSTSDATIHGMTVGLGPGSFTSNLAVGVGALSAITTAVNNTAIGSNALHANQTQGSNLALGSGALGSLTSGTSNVAIGANAGASSTNIGGSVLIGGNAGVGATATSIVAAVGIGNNAILYGGGTQPVAIGSSALAAQTAGQGNVAIGFSAGSRQTSCGGNILIGFNAGVTGTVANANVSGSNNVYIGYNAGPGTSTQLGNSIAIGYLAVCTASNQIVLGNTSVTDSRINGDWSVQNAGRGLRVAEGTNCKQGTAVLVAGTVVVSNTKVTANSRIFLTGQVDGGTPGWVRVSARTAGTSFTITSSSATDTSTIAYQIFEPA